jgi:hypothetical protein
MNDISIRAQVLEFLASRQVKDGETIEYGWFIFDAIVKNEQLDLQTLDFKKMASFTTDFSAVETIHAEQMKVLDEEKADPCWCALWHSATISRSYTPGHQSAFLHRMNEKEGNDSGWYVGVTDDPLDVNDPKNLHLQSLYELTIHDRRLAPYWLLPVGYRVYVSDRNIVVLET